MIFANGDGTYTVTVIADVRIEVKDERVFTHGQERDTLDAIGSRDAMSTDEVLNYLAENCIYGNFDQASDLEGWADLEPGAAHMFVTGVTPD